MMPLSEKDQKIKKRWRIAFAINLVFNLISTYTTFSQLDTQGEMPGFFLVFAIFLVGLFALTYYFSYVKQGYQLLTMVLIWPFISLLGNASKLKGFFEINSFADVVIVVLGALLVNGWWYYASIQLILLNKRLKASALPPECNQGIAQMQTAQSQQELDNKFHALINQFPQFEPILSKEYQERKKVLEKEKTLESSLS